MISKTKIYFLILVLNSLFVFSNEKTIICGRVDYPDSEKIDLSFFVNDLTLATEELLYRMPIDFNDEFYFDLKINSSKEVKLNYNNVVVKLFVEVGDSVFIKFNGNDMLSSIRISGVGAGNNNYMIQKFKKFDSLKYINKNEVAYLSYLDSLKNNKQNFYREYLSSYSVSNGFKNYAQAELNYKIANLRFEFAKNNQVSRSYYKFLDDIEIYNSEAIHSNQYKIFLRNYIDYLYKKEYENDSEYEYYEKYELAKTCLESEVLCYMLSEYILFSIHNQELNTLINSTDDFFKNYNCKNKTLVRESISNLLDSF